MDLHTLIDLLKGEGWTIQQKHLAFDGENEGICQGVRVFVCRNGNNYLTFKGGIDQAIHVKFLQVKQKLPHTTECKTIQEAIDLMKKPQEGKK